MKYLMTRSLPVRRALAATLALTLALGASPLAHAQRRGAPKAADKAEKNDNVEDLSLGIGETKTISAHGVKNYSEGVPNVVDVKVTTDGQNFVVAGRRAGSTTLLLIFENGQQKTYNINVFAQPPAVIEKELTSLLEGVNGVHLRRVGSHTVIDGSVASEADLKRVQQVASLYHGQVESLVTVGNGPAPPPETGDGYLIRIDFYFVQYDKNSSYGVGIGFPDSIGGAAFKATLTFDAVTGATRSATATLANQPLPRLDIAARHGWAKVMRQATLVTNNGVSAEWENGGEQNFPVAQGLTATIHKIKFGADVSVVPVYHPETRDLTVKVTADISDLTEPASGSNLPGRTLSKLQTEVGLKLGQALILSGIRTRAQTHNVTGLPFLSEIPILGLLFGSHANLELETEAAIFIIPSVITSAPTASKEMVDAALSKFKAYSGDLEHVEAYRKAPGSALDIPDRHK